MESNFLPSSIFEWNKGVSLLAEDLVAQFIILSGCKTKHIHLSFQTQKYLFKSEKYFTYFLLVLRYAAPVSSFLTTLS